MDRQELDQARLAAALVVTAGDRHSAKGRRDAYHLAQELYAALEDADVTEVTLAMAMHGAWCDGTRSATFHPWSHHRPEAGELYEALCDPTLDARLASRAEGAEPARDD
jgi:hypothetical protein